jgi:hypothetical protein
MRFIVIITLISFTIGCSGPEDKKSTKASEKSELTTAEYINNVDDGKDHMYAVISTSKGDIIVELAYEVTPLTVANFVALSEGNMANPYKQQGEPFYDGLVFHRVMQNFMIQGVIRLVQGAEIRVIVLKMRLPI